MGEERGRSKEGVGVWVEERGGREDVVGVRERKRGGGGKG